jgi:cyclase
MLKKRLIFTLLYNRGQFMLSRNFRLQRVGDLKWLQTNYDFSRISFSIDELVVLDVTRVDRNTEAFCAALKVLTEGCFVPIAAGGGVRTVEHARLLLRSGADKVVVNSALGDGPFVAALASEFGRQCIVASIDVKRDSEGTYRAWAECGSRQIDGSAARWIAQATDSPVGELYLNSMDRDGTGQGYDLALLDQLPPVMPKPVILAGGAGNGIHLAEGLTDPRVDAVATAHLFNFVGDGLKQARQSLIASGFVLPLWDVSVLDGKLRDQPKRHVD